jgi:O-antigen/teichoic acid export membrane protein
MTTENAERFRSRAGPSSSGIAGRIVRAAGAQGANQAVRVLQLFVLVPICLTAWGTAAYEDWLLAYAISAFLALGDLGYVQLTTVKLIEAWSMGDKERFSTEWTRALGTLAVISLALICALGVLWMLPSWTVLIPTRTLSQREVAATVVLLCLGQVCGVLIVLGLAAYRGRNDLSRSYHIWSFLVVLQTAGIAGPAASGGGPVASAIGSLFVSGATLAWIVADLLRCYPDMKWRPIFPRVGEFLKSTLRAIQYLVHPATLTMMINGPSLILANFGAPHGAIALFTTSRTIAGVARQLPYQFAHPAGVELAGLLARGDREGLSRVYASASRALAIIVGVLGGFTVVAAPLVMTLWTRGKVAYDADVMFLLVGATTICAPSQVAYMLLWYGGYPSPLNRALFFSTGAALGFAALLCPLLGARGVAMGLGAGEILGIAWYLSVLVDRMLGRRAGTGLLLNLSISLVSFFSSAGIGYVLHRLIEPRGWIGLVELGILWSIPTAIGLFFALPTARQRVRLADTMRAAIRAWAPKG